MLITRVIRFCRNEIGLWLAAWPALIAFLIYRYPDPLSAVILVTICVLCFCVTFPLRSKVVLSYRSYRRPITSLIYVIIAAAIVMRFVGHYQIFQFAMAAYFSLILGLIFWAASDPVFEMVNWLAFPTEFGRVPDEIQLFDTRMIDWPDTNFKVRAHLFRFRYEREWDYGLTGPITFALGDQDFEGKTPEEIYAAYKGWYDKEDIGGMIKSELEGDATV